MSVTWLAWAASARRLSARVGADVDGEVDLGLRRAERVAVVGRPVGIEVLARSAWLGHHRATRASRLKRDLEALRRAGQVGGPVPDAVDLDVVGVAVAAVPVVEHDDVGVLLAEDRGQPLGGLVDVGPPERRRVVVLLPAGHPRVAVAEPHDAGHAEHAGRRRRSPAPAVDERLAVGRGRRAPRRARRWCTRRARRGGPRRRPGPSTRPSPLASSSGWAWTNTIVAIRPPRVATALRHLSVRLGCDRADPDGRCEAQLATTAPSSTSASMRSLGMPQSSSASRVCWPGWAGGERAISGAVRLKRGRRCRLLDAVALDDRRAGDVVRVLGRLGHRQHRGEADVGVLHQRAPLVAGLAREHLGEPLLQRRPAATCPSAWRTPGRRPAR